MLAAARMALGDDATRPRLVAVTVLTSFDLDTLHAVGVTGDIGGQVRRLAQLSQAAGLDGVVCSPLEIELVRAISAPDFVLVTPGVRPAAVSADDQRRIATPTAAITAGASFLVVGRPVTQSLDPLAAVAALNREIAFARAAR